MSKAAIVTDAITIVGIIAISALAFSQVPGMVNDIKETLSQESVKAQSVEIANLLTLVSSSPNNIEIIHNLPPGNPYSVTVDGGYVTVETKDHKAVSKTFSSLSFGPDVVSSLSITKNEIREVG